MARAYQEARRAATHGADRRGARLSPGVPSTPPADAAELRERAVTAVRSASDLLREKGTSADLRECGDFVVAVCEAVARAHKEGGVLGFGAKEVSEAEQATMDNVLRPKTLHTGWPTVSSSPSAAASRRVESPRHRLGDRKIPAPPADARLEAERELSFRSLQRRLTPRRPSPTTTTTPITPSVFGSRSRCFSTEAAI